MLLLQWLLRLVLAVPPLAFSLCLVAPICVGLARSATAEEGMQTPLYAVAVALILIGIFAFGAVLLRLV